MYQFERKDSEKKTYPLSQGNISEEFKPNNRAIRNCKSFFC